MKTEVTQKWINSNYKNRVIVNFGASQYLLKYIDADYYNAGKYGHNADIYHINLDTVIITGDRPFGNIKADYKLTEKFNNEAMEIFNNDRFNPEVKEKINKLLKQFVNEVLK